jgi:signal transduction histidine kinase
VVDGQCLVVTVSDDGAGGADAGGSGLTGLGDRLAVLNGELSVRAGDAGGTVVEATIPVAELEGLA